MATVSVKLRPLGDRIVVKALARETVTKSGIVLPDTAKEKSTRGEVLAVGSGRLLPNGRVVKVAVDVGDIVLYSKYGGSDVKVDGKELKIVQESEILAILG